MSLEYIADPNNATKSEIDHSNSSAAPIFADGICVSSEVCSTEVCESHLSTSDEINNLSDGVPPDEALSSHKADILANNRDSSPENDLSDYQRVNYSVHKEQYSWKYSPSLQLSIRQLTQDKTLLYDKSIEKHPVCSDCPSLQNLSPNSKPEVENISLAASEESIQEDTCTINANGDDWLSNPTECTDSLGYSPGHWDNNIIVVPALILPIKDSWTKKDQQETSELVVAANIVSIVAGKAHPSSHSSPDPKKPKDTNADSAMIC